MESVVKKETIHFCEVTSLKGVPRIVKSKEKKLQVLWFVATMCFFGLTLSAVIDLVASYFDYQSVTNTLQIPLRDLDLGRYLPAVTVCDRNPYSSDANYSIVKYSPWDFYGQIHEMAANSTLPPITHAWLTNQASPIGYFQYIGSEKAKLVGHTLDDFIMSCHMMTFLGNNVAHIPCDKVGNIKLVQMPEFFNCFNVILDDPSIYVEKNMGIPYGIQLTLYLDNFYQSHETYHNLDSTMGKTEGAIVYVHPPKESADPTHSVDVLPGTNADIRLHLNLRKRLPPPHGNCTDGTHFKSYGFNDSTQHYTEYECVERCLAVRYLENCSCVDARNTLHYLNTSGYPYCETLDEGIDTALERVNCTLEVYEEYVYACLLECDPKCEEIHFGTTPSYSKWPSLGYQISFYEKHVKPERYGKRFESTYEPILEMAKEGKMAESWRGLRDADLLEDNFVDVNIYIAENQITILEDVPMTSISWLMSQLGGSLNLYSGITFVLLVEILEYIYLLVRGWACCAKNAIVSRRKSDAHKVENNGIGLQGIQNSYYPQSVPSAQI